MQRTKSVGNPNRSLIIPYELRQEDVQLAMIIQFPIMISFHHTKGARSIVCYILSNITAKDRIHYVRSKYGLCPLLLFDCSVI